MGKEALFDMASKLIKAIAVLALAILGAFMPRWILHDSGGLWMIVGAGLGILLGILFGPRFLRLARRSIVARLIKIDVNRILAGGAGLLFGLIISALGLVLSRQILGHSSPPWEMLGVSLAVLGSLCFSLVKSEELAAVFRPSTATPERTMDRARSRGLFKVLDTSAIIDGRIADICKTGFLEGTLLVPGFVLAELQRIADSSDSLKRNRGRRGLDILNRMQKEGMAAVKIYDRDFDDLSEVDTKIVRLARLVEAKVVTNDFNLNKVAELYGVPVLNINELSNAIKPVVLPGEEMSVHIIKDGKESGQGIGYLEDGTMVVVDGGRQYIGEDLEVLVTSVLQTSAGRMIFGKPKEHARHALAQNQ